ncbi:MAG TPA: serine hydrolase [Ramlibacter sp.]|nr:serine hydrolase [Ramlibacter sp.]
MLLPFAPAGAMSASATSMARFMIAQLQDGAYGNTRMLGDSIARFMHGRAFAQDPRLDGYDYGFYEQTSHGVHLIGHGGDTQWFHSDLTLAPEDGWGIFVSYNSQPGGSLSFGPFLQAVLDHYYPVETASLGEATGDSVDTAYLGSYRVNRSSYTTLEKVLGLLSNVTVARDPKHAGVLVVHSPLGTGRFIAAGHDLFREIDGSDRIAFQRDARDRVTHFFINSAPIMAMERLAWYQAPRLHQVLLVLSLLLLGTVPFVMIGSWLLHRRFRQLAPLSGGERLARWAALLAACLAVAFGVGLMSVVSNPSDFIKGNAAGLNVVLGLPVLLAVDAIALIAFTLRAWQRGWWGWWGRGHYTAVAIAGVVLVSVLAYWNLLGWRY